LTSLLSYPLRLNEKEALSISVGSDFGSVTTQIYRVGAKSPLGGC
jgi:hypothetical protein